MSFRKLYGFSKLTVHKYVDVCIIWILRRRMIKTMINLVDNVHYDQYNCDDDNIIIVGQAGGNNHNNKGGGSNYLCLPNDPDNGKPYSYANDVLFGGEYEVGGSAKPSGLANLQEKDVTCAVCRRRGKSSVLMIPGTRFIF